MILQKPCSKERKDQQQTIHCSFSTSSASQRGGVQLTWRSEEKQVGRLDTHECFNEIEKLVIRQKDQQEQRLGQLQREGKREKYKKKTKKKKQTVSESEHILPYSFSHSVTTCSVPFVRIFQNFTLELRRKIKRSKLLLNSSLFLTLFIVFRDHYRLTHWVARNTERKKVWQPRIQSIEWEEKTKGIENIMVELRIK